MARSAKANPQPNPFVRWLAACSIAVVLVGCGAVKMGYNHLETLTMLWANRYIALDSEQEAFARAGIERFLAWHRPTQLPDYAQFLTQVGARIQQPMSPGDVVTIENEGRERMHRAIERALPDLAELALMIRPDQLMKMQTKFADNDEEYRKNFVDLPPAKRQRNLFNKVLDRVEFWYGRLSDEQRDELRRAVDAQPTDTTLWLHERQAREQELLDLMRRITTQHPSKEVVVGWFRAYSARLETSPAPDHRRYIEALARSNAELYAMVANMATPKQRAAALAATRSWANDMVTLSRKPMD